MRLQINISYTVFCASLGTAGLAFIGWAMTSQVYEQWSQGLPITGGLSWPFVIGADLMCCLGVLAIYWKIYADANTAIEPSGLSRPSLRGQTYIAWSEVTALEVVNGFGYHVHAGTRRIIVTPYAYREPENVIEALYKYCSQRGNNELSQENPSK